jgi:prephenate dehydrogenase
VLLAVPVSATGRPSKSATLSINTLIMDVGSTKRDVVDAAVVCCATRWQAALVSTSDHGQGILRW